MRALLTVIVALLLCAPQAVAQPDVTPNVVGGRPATEAYPFAASLQNTNGGHFCGAVLIRPNWLATARHCVQGDPPSSVRARVGSTNRTSGGTLVQATRIVVHPQTDVAVVQLASSVPHPPLQIAASAPAGSAIRLLGWGATCDPCSTPLPTVLQELDTTVLPDSRCGTGTPELCVSNIDGWRGACYGDSGGPAVMKVGTAWQLVGTTTGGTSAICGQGPSIYMDSTTHRAWIDGIVGGGPPPGKEFSNDTDVPIPDLATAESPIVVSGVTGNAPATLRVDVTVRHSYRGDLVLSLLSPNGTVYPLEDFPNNDSGDDVVKSYTVNASASPANGTWRLRVQDVARQDAGRIDAWSLVL